MAYQPKEYFKIKLQLFADEGGGDSIPADSADPFDNLPSISYDNDDELLPDDKPEVTEESVNPDPVTPTAEEFDEILYNHEQVKIPVSERQTYLQKGYHFDKVKAEADQLKSELAEYNEYKQFMQKEWKINSLRELKEAQINSSNQQQKEAMQDKPMQVAQETYQQYINAGYSDEEAREKANVAYSLENANLKIQMLENKINGVETTTKQQQEQEAFDRNASEGTRLILGDYEQLSKDYGDMLPKIEGTTPLDKLHSLVTQLDPETIADMEKGMSFKKAFIANNHDSLLKKQQELTEQRTVANISDRAKKGTDTNKTDVKPTENKLSDRQKSFAKIFGVPASEVAKRI